MEVAVARSGHDKRLAGGGETRDGNEHGGGAEEVRKEDAGVAERLEVPFVDPPESERNDGNRQDDANEGNQRADDEVPRELLGWEPGRGMEDDAAGRGFGVQAPGLERRLWPGNQSRAAGKMGSLLEGGDTCSDERSRVSRLH